MRQTHTFEEIGNSNEKYCKTGENFLPTEAVQRMLCFGQSFFSEKIPVQSGKDRYKKALQGESPY